MEKTDFKTKFRRVLKAGFFNFWRSGYVSLASIIVMIVTLGVIGAVIFTGTILNISLQELRDKVDINVYFTIETSEDSILALKKKVESLIEVQSVEYVSREKALEDFRLRHENDQIIIQGLEELEDNPLGAALNIKAKDPAQYESIANFLNEEKILSSNGEQLIDEITYSENRTMIDRLARLINSVEKMGLLISLALVVVSIIITFNTIRLAIYISREEISVMQLVGASKNYIKGPFVITGIIVGLISGVITILVFFPTLYAVGGTTQNFLIGFNIFEYYVSNFFEFALVLIGAGVGIGALSSFLAVRRYLKL